jgi:hypothetical protein
MTPYHTRPETTNPPCEQGRGCRPYDAARPLGHRVTTRSISLSFPRPPSRPLSPHSPLPTPPPPPDFPTPSTQDLARYFPRESVGGGRRRNLFPSLGIPCSRLSADHLPLGNIPRFIHPKEVARKRRA